MTEQEWTEVMARYEVAMRRTGVEPMKPAQEQACVSLVDELIALVMARLKLMGDGARLDALRALQAMATVNLRRLGLDLVKQNTGECVQEGCGALRAGNDLWCEAHRPNGPAADRLGLADVAATSVGGAVPVELQVTLAAGVEATAKG
jgi:hypothetical protein